ncbi:AAA family ATPase, partial [Klebsiella aerogenes]
FNELYLKQLKTLNIIAGKNNYGKTSILDAIFCFYDVKNPAVLLNIQAFRKEMAEINKNKPFWVSYFHDMDTSQKMSIVIRDERSEVTQTYETETNQRLESSLSLNVDTVLSNQNIPRQTIGSQATVNSLKINVTETPNAKNRVSNKLFSMQLKEDGVEIKSEIKNERDGINYKFKTATIITTSRKINKEATITNVSSLLTQKRKKDILENLKKIDDRIVDIAISAIGNNKEIYLDIGFSELNEISMLGEGISRALSFISSVLVQENSIILIDEIENGIHYSVIKDIIKSLISSAKQNNNQIFATTHSQDVIRAINEIDSKNEDIAYIRLGREKNSLKPTAVQFNMDDFSYSVENDWEVR